MRMRPSGALGEEQQHLVRRERQAVGVEQLGVERPVSAACARSKPRHAASSARQRRVGRADGVTDYSCVCNNSSADRRGNTAMIDSLQYRLRPAAGDPEGALVLLHGRGADENDLFPLLDLLDPERRLVGATAPRPAVAPARRRPLVRGAARSATRTPTPSTRPTRGCRAGSTRCSPSRACRPSARCSAGSPRAR